MPIEGSEERDAIRDAAYADLDSLDEESRDEGFEPCSELAKDNARRLLLALSHEDRPAPAIYPTSDREVAIMFNRAGDGNAVLILCASNGEVACFASIRGSNRRARYDSARGLPDAIILDQLQQQNETWALS